EELGRARIRIVSLGQVDVDDVVRRAGGEPGPLPGADDVVGRCDQVAQRPRRAQVVVERAQGLDLGHRRRQATTAAATRRRPQASSATGVSSTADRRSGADSAATETRCSWTQMTAATTTRPPAIWAGASAWSWTK